MQAPLNPLVQEVDQAESVPSRHNTILPSRVLNYDVDFFYFEHYAGTN